jgi:hypothetical protein
MRADERGGRDRGRDYNIQENKRDYNSRDYRGENSGRGDNYHVGNNDNKSKNHDRRMN